MQIFNVGRWLIILGFVLAGCDAMVVDNGYMWTRVDPLLSEHSVALRCMRSDTGRCYFYIGKTTTAPAQDFVVVEGSAAIAAIPSEPAPFCSALVQKEAFTCDPRVSRLGTDGKTSQYIPANCKRVEPPGVGWLCP
jgi:hypothetical protein